MSQRSIDPAIATRLSSVDDALSLLPEAIATINRRRGWQLADVRWSPGKECRLAYRVESPDLTPNFVAITISADRWWQQDYRDDPALAGVDCAADEEEVDTRLSGDRHHGSRWNVEPVRYRPGSRCVWRYTDAEGVETALFAKAFRASEFPRQLTLVGALDPSRRRGLVPDVIAIWPELHVIVSEAVEGRSLSTVIADPGVSSVERSRLLYRLGALLADFHAQPTRDVPAYTADDQLAAIEPALGAAHRVDPRVADRLSAVLAVLARSRPSGRPEVLGHGAFRAGQVIVGDDGEIMMIDTDGVARCDAARDLGRALAHLSWQGVRQRGRASALRGTEGALLDGYASNAGPIESDALRWWRAAALVQLAARRYSRLEHDDWPHVPLVVDEAERVLSASDRRPATNGAVDLLDVDVVSALVGPVLASDGASAGSIKVISAEHLATRSRRRTVVRYRVSGLESPQTIDVIGKAFADDDHARRLHTNLSLLANGPFANSPIRVPRPLGYVQEQRLVLWVACDGVPLDRITRPADAEDGVRRAARWLARLHSSNVVLPRRFSVEEEAATTRGWATRIGEVDQRLADQAGHLADGWVTAVGSGTDGRAPIHKDFHPGHVLIGDDTSVIDLDEARQGDPAFDVAHFLTYLQLLSIHNVADPGLADAFVKEYVGETGWRDAGTLDGYRAYAWLKIAKQWAIGSGPAQEASLTERVASAADALTRGEQCLRV